MPTDGKTIKKVAGKASAKVRDAVDLYNKAVEKANAGRKGLAALGWGEEKKNDRPRTPKTDTALQNARSELNELREAFGDWARCAKAPLRNGSGTAVLTKTVMCAFWNA